MAGNPAGQWRGRRREAGSRLLYPTLRVVGGEDYQLAANGRLQVLVRGMDGVAVREATSSGVHVCCASLDPSENAESYLSRIFGPGRYLRVRDPDALPDRLPELLRDLIG